MQMSEYSVVETESEDLTLTLRTAARRVNELSNPKVELARDQRQRLLDDAQADMLRAKQSIKRISSQLPGLQGQRRQRYQTLLRSSQSDFGRLERDLVGLRLREERGQLFGDVFEGNSGRQQPGSTASADSRLVSSQQSLQRSTNQLNATKRTMEETEQLGTNIMESMVDQRESLLRSQAKVKETTNLAGEAKQILREMFLRTIYNKAMLVSIIVLLVISIGLVIYFLYIK